MKNNLLLIALLALAAPVAEAQLRTAFALGQPWPDNHGTPLNAHGAGVLYDRGRYYLFGEHKIAGPQGNSAQVGVHCYSSTDLYNWRDEGIALAVAPAGSGSEIEKGCVLERPKVVFNQKTKQYVMWFHLELKGQGYAAARTAVAVSSRATGPYRYLRSYRPGAGQWPLGFQEAWKQPVPGEKDLKWWTPDWYKAVAEGLFVRRDFAAGQMARDMTIFVDDDGRAYHISSSEDNLTLHLAELTADYQSFTGRWSTIAPAGHNEAPALCKARGEVLPPHERLHRLGSQRGPLVCGQLHLGAVAAARQPRRGGRGRLHLPLAEHLPAAGGGPGRGLHLYGRPLDAQKPHRRRLYLAAADLRGRAAPVALGR